MGIAVSTITQANSRITMAQVTDRLAHWSAGPVAPSFTPHRGPLPADEPTPARAFAEGQIVTDWCI